MAYQHILVPVDGSDIALNVVSHVVALAQAFQSKVSVVQVMTLDPYIASEYLSKSQSNEIIERARGFIVENLDKAKAQFSQQGIEVETRLLEGESIHRSILQAVEQLNVDLVVMSSHGRSGIKKLLMGNVAQSLMSEVTVPVLVIR